MTALDSFVDGDDVSPSPRQPITPRGKRGPKACALCHSKKIKCDVTRGNRCSYCLKHDTQCVPRPRQKRKPKQPDYAPSEDEVRSSIIVKATEECKVLLSNQPRHSSVEDVRDGDIELAFDNISRAIKYYCTYLSPLIPIEDVKTREEIAADPGKAMNGPDAILVSAIYVAAGPYLNFPADEVEGLYHLALCDILTRLCRDTEPPLSLLRAIQVLIAFTKEKKPCLPYLLYQAQERVHNPDDRAMLVSYVLMFAGCTPYSAPGRRPSMIDFQSALAAKAQIGLLEMELTTNGDDIWLCSLASACLTQKTFFDRGERIQSFGHDKVEEYLGRFRLQFFPTPPCRYDLRDFLIHVIQASYWQSQVSAPTATEATQSTDLHDELMQECEKHTSKAFEHILRIIEKRDRSENEDVREPDEEWQQVSHLKDILLFIIPPWLLEMISQWRTTSLGRQTQALDVNDVIEYMRSFQASHTDFQHTAFPASTNEYTEGSEAVSDQVAEMMCLPATSEAPPMTPLVRQTVTSTTHEIVSLEQQSSSLASPAISTPQSEDRSIATHSSRRWPRGLGF